MEDAIGNRSRDLKDSLDVHNRQNGRDLGDIGTCENIGFRQWPFKAPKGARRIARRQGTSWLFLTACFRLDTRAPQLG
jgi:hypothetical protein